MEISNIKLRGNGFTLVEVMVALLILALSLTALQLRISRQIENSSYLRDKAVAGWVAQNTLEMIRLESRLQNTVINEVRTGTESMGGKDWRWQVAPQNAFQNVDDATESSRILPVVITVADSDFPDSPLVTLTGVTDAWHRLQ